MLLGIITSITLEYLSRYFLRNYLKSKWLDNLLTVVDVKMLIIGVHSWNPTCAASVLSLKRIRKIKVALIKVVNSTKIN